VLECAGRCDRTPVSRKPLDVDDVVAELREIAKGRGDLPAERAGVTLGFYARENGTSGCARRSRRRYSSLPVPT
jgi:hypothetical protein